MSPAKRSTSPTKTLVGDAEPRAVDSGRGEIVAQTYERLRELIVRGQLAPGSRVVESDIAARLGVSRTPVRSALHRLQQEGYIASGDGARDTRLTIAPLTQNDALELFMIIGVLEGLGAREAAKLPPLERTALVTDLREINTNMLQEAQRPRRDILQLFEVDTLFHRRYMIAASGKRLLSMHDAIKPQGERYIRLYYSSLSDEIATSVKEHEVIISQIEKGDAVAAQNAVDRNWRNAASRLNKVIAAVGERGSW